MYTTQQNAKIKSAFSKRDPIMRKAAVEKICSKLGKKEKTVYGHYLGLLRAAGTPMGKKKGSYKPRRKLIPVQTSTAFQQLFAQAPSTMATVKEIRVKYEKVRVDTEAGELVFTLKD